MNAIVVALPIDRARAVAHRARQPKQPKMVVRGVNSPDYITVPYAPSTGQRTGIAPRFTRQTRPGDKDAVIRQFAETNVLALDLFFAKLDFVHDDVEGELLWFSALVTHEEAFIIQGMSPTFAGPWYITQLSYDYQDFQPGTNRITRAVAHCEFTQASDVTLSIGPVSGGVKSPAKGGSAHKKPVKTPAKARTYTVKRGDTLSGIAAKILHDANRWGEIAHLNRIRNPNLIFPGQVLKLP